MRIESFGRTFPQLRFDADSQAQAANPTVVAPSSPPVASAAHAPAETPIAALWQDFAALQAKPLCLSGLNAALGWMQPGGCAASTVCDAQTPKLGPAWAPRTKQEVEEANKTACGGAVDGQGDPGQTYTSQARAPFGPLGNSDVDRGQAAIERMLVDTSVGSQIQNDEFEVIAHDNGNFTLVLPGVIDLSTPHFGLDSHSQSVRDIDQTALSSSVNSRVASNRYAQMVSDYVLDPNNGIPRGANVMLVGHSLGGDTVLDLASDPTFNNAQTGVNVTHVVTAAYFNQPELDQVPASTQVLVLQNAKDVPVIAEGLGYSVTEARNAAGRVVEGAKNTFNDAKRLFGSILGGDAGEALDSGGDIVNRAQRALTPDTLPMPDAVALVSTGVREVDGHIVEARFNGGSDGAGHRQTNYIDYVNGAGKNDPLVSSFYDSVAKAGYAAPGQTRAVDVSVSDPNYSTTYPGDGAVEEAKSLWDRIPGSGLIEDVVDAGADVVGAGADMVSDGAAYAWEHRSVLADARDTVRDGVVGTWNSLPGNDAVEWVVGSAADHLPFNNAMGAAFEALSGSNHISLDADATQAIQADAGFLQTEAEIVASIQQYDGFGERALTIPLADLDVNLVVELGGQRGAGSMKEQFMHIYDLSDANVRQTWQVAANELTWLLRHARLDGTAHVAQDGSITIDYNIHDRLDLRASPGRSEAYNTASTVLGTVWHDVLGAEEAQVTGSFSRSPSLPP
jgi:hypothetical protein